jgi:mRNA-degrading endonuclease RelE of RelBE toxin-antitoxin system
MIVKSSESFFKDLSKIRNIDVFDEIENIFDMAHASTVPESIPGFKALDQHSGYARIDAGNYRIGVRYSQKTIIFYRVMHRSVIYKIFP